jgi:hypothetical protein
MQDVGVPRKGWNTAHLDNTRETHLENEALSDSENGIPIDETWPNGLDYPSDPSGPPEEVINCRCFGFAILEEGKSARRVKLLSYEEWLSLATNSKEAKV